MKKFLLTMVSLLLLSGCAQVNNAPSTDNINTYNNEEFNVSFQYPPSWEVIDKRLEKGLLNGEVINVDKKFEHSVVLKTGGNESIYFDYDSVSFDEYEKPFESFETFEIDGEEYGGFSIEEITIANYPAKKYKEWGIELAGITYIIEKNGKFLAFNTEYGLSEEQKVGVEKILNSLEFE